MINNSILKFYVIQHPNIESGWIYLTEKKAQESLIQLKSLKSISSKGINLDKFTISPFEVADKNITSIIFNTYPELDL